MPLAFATAAERRMRTPTKRELPFLAWWELFDAAMRKARLAAPGMQLARAHYEAGHTPDSAVAEQQVSGP